MKTELDEPKNRKELYGLDVCYIGEISATKRLIQDTIQQSSAFWLQPIR